MRKIECVVNIENGVGASPAWSIEQQALWWVDIPGRTMHSWHPASDRRDNWRLPDTPGCLALREDDGLLLALRSGTYFFDLFERTMQKVLDIEVDLPDNRFSDGRCDRHGRLWVGTMLNNFSEDGKSKIPIDRAAGSIYCIEPDLSWRRVDGDFWIPSTIDSGVNEIYAYDFDLDAGVIENRRSHAKNLDTGQLGGSAIDSEGYLWNTHWGASKIVRYAPDGGIDRELDLPVPQPTNCVFGGQDLDTLYITTARDGMSQDELLRYPLSGSVFAVKPGVRGLPEPIFGG